MVDQSGAISNFSAFEEVVRGGSIIENRRGLSGDYRVKKI